MQYKQCDNNFQIYLERGDFVMKELTDFCNEHKIFNGSISGIGAVKNIELGAYSPTAKQYTRKTFENTHELINSQGNIMLLDGKSFIHVHITIGNHDMVIFGGHLFEMEIAVVGEFIIQKIDGNSKRTMDNEIGFATWDLIDKG